MSATYPLEHSPGCSPDFAEAHPPPHLTVVAAHLGPDNQHRGQLHPWDIGHDQRKVSRTVLSRFPGLCVETIPLHFPRDFRRYSALLRFWLHLIRMDPKEHFALQVRFDRMLAACRYGSRTDPERARFRGQTLWRPESNRTLFGPASAPVRSSASFPENPCPPVQPGCPDAWTAPGHPTTELRAAAN